MTPEWRAEAACRQMGPDVFFPDPADLKGLARAQLVCRYCSVKDECADHALVEGERYGVWAGVNVGIATDAETRRRKNAFRAERRRELYAADEDYAKVRREQAHRREEAC